MQSYEKGIKCLSSALDFLDLKGTSWPSFQTTYDNPREETRKKRASELPFI